LITYQESQNLAFSLFSAFICCAWFLK